MLLYNGYSCGDTSQSAAGGPRAAPDSLARSPGSPHGVRDRPGLEARGGVDRQGRRTRRLQSGRAARRTDAPGPAEPCPGERRDHLRGEQHGPGLQTRLHGGRERMRTGFLRIFLLARQPVEEVPGLKLNWDVLLISRVFPFFIEIKVPQV